MTQYGRSRMPPSLLAATLVLGTLGVGRALFAVILASLAYQAGVKDVQAYLPFLLHFAAGIVIMVIAIALVRRSRAAWVAALLACGAMLFEEIVQPVSAFGGEASLRILAAAIYVAAMILLLWALSSKTSRQYLNHDSAKP